uniref:DUF2946 domain-containing protein n=1 Tax=Polynucleobacter necessarius subsp. necessarius (strain STIR1) TaxID=452638 RepID=B1XVF3_POLNS
MHFIKQRKLVHWIAALAILLGSLAPAVSQALSLDSNGQRFVVEICTTSGAKMTQVIGNEESSSSPAMGGHCPYCVVQPIYLLPCISAVEFVALQSYATQSQSAYQAPQILSA